MRIVVTGASGNVGTSVLRRAAADGDVDVVCIARRNPDESAETSQYAGVTWGVRRRRSASIRNANRRDGGADAVSHLAWQITPSRDDAAMRRTKSTGLGR